MPLVEDNAFVRGEGPLRRGYPFPRLRVGHRIGT